MFSIPPQSPSLIDNIRAYKTSLWAEEDSAKRFIERTDEKNNPFHNYNKVVNELFLGKCFPGARVLDLGCGQGQASISLASNGCRVVACDISAPLLSELARTKGDLDIEIRQGDGYAIPAVDGEFDVVVARMFLCHFVDWHNILREMSRVCKIDGHIVYSFFTKENRELAVRDCRHDASAHYYSSDPQSGGGNFASEATKDEIKGACNAVGLTLQSVIPFSFFYYNALIGYSIGPERIPEYRARLAEFLKTPEVLEFVLWFEREVVVSLPHYMTMSSVVEAKKTFAV